MAKLVVTKLTGDYWSFVVDGDTANEILNTRNDLLVYGNNCHFKTANGANLIQRQDIFPTDVTIVSSQTYNPVDKHQLFEVLIAEGYFDWFRGGGSGGTGVDRFDELLDTFKYVGKDGMCVVVDETQLRLVAVPFYNVSKTTQLSDMPQAIVNNMMLVSNETGTGYKFLPIPQEPETFLNAVGYFIYDDLATKTTPIPFTGNNRVLIANDGDGNLTNFQQAPFGIAKIWDVDANQIDNSELAIGDMVDLRIRLETTTNTQNQKYKIIFKNAIGSGFEAEATLYTTATKSAGVDSSTFYLSYGVTTLEQQQFPSELWFESDGNGSFKVMEFYFRIIRKNINIVQIGAEGLELKEDKVNKRPIIGNETSLIAYPSAKDVVDYVASKGTGNIDQVLTQGNTSDQPMLLEKSYANFFSVFHPNNNANGIVTSLLLVTGNLTNSLYHQSYPNSFIVELQQQNDVDFYVTGIYVTINSTYLKGSYQDKTTGNLNDYILLVDFNGILIQKKLNAVTRRLRFKLDNLTADRTVQAPDEDGVMALQSSRDPIKITTSGNINISTTDGSGKTQSRKELIMIDNGASNITFTVNGTAGFYGTYLKLGSGSITFVAGAGRTIFQADGLLVCGGAKGSTFTIISNGTEDILMINNR